MRRKRVLTVNAGGMRPGNLARLLDCVQDIYEKDVVCEERSDGLAVYLDNWRSK